MIARADMPLAYACAVVAVGRDDVVLGLEGGDGADGDRLLPDVEVEEAADLALRVGLRRRLLHAPDGQHLAVVAGELGLVVRTGGVVGPGSLTLKCAHCQDFSSRVGMRLVDLSKCANIYQAQPCPGNFWVGFLETSGLNS